MNIRMATPLVVFVCSTFADLAQERESVLQAIARLKLQHDSMEYFGARSGQPLETCLNEVGRSNLIVVIVGHRYGSLAHNLGISFTQAEYDEAQRLRKPCLVYMRNEDVPVLPKFVESDPAKLQLLQAWKGVLTSRHTVAGFRGAADLAMRVATDISRTLDELVEPERDTFAADTNSRGIWPDVRHLVAKALATGVSESTVLRAIRRSLRTLTREPVLVAFSYAATDRSSVKVFVAALESEGINVWTAESDLEAGTLWEHEIKHTLQVAEFIVFFISSASMGSRAVQAELRHVLNRRVAGETAPFLIPVLLEQVEVPPLLRDVHWIDASRGNIGGAVERLVKSIRSGTEGRPAE